MNPPTPALVIRGARMSDWPQLHSLVPAVFTHLQADEVSHLLRRHHRSTVVASEGHVVVGYYQFYAHAEPGVAWLNHMGVSPGRQGRGVGKDLLAFFERHAKTCGFSSAALDAFEHNVGAHRFYLRNGYTMKERQMQEDGVKLRFVRSLDGIAELGHAMPVLQPAGPVTWALRKLIYVALTAWPWVPAQP